MAAAAGPDTVAEAPVAGDAPARGDAAAASPPAGRRRRTILAGIAVLLLAGLGVGAVAVIGRYLDDRSRDAHRQALVAAATAGVVAMIDVDTDSADADLDRLRDLSTGPFADELADGRTGLAAAIREFAVRSDGSVDSAALATDAGGGGVVLVAASASVANSDSPTATPRSYRLRVTVEDVGDRLLMSGMEFVP
ncbi:hypothetical protein ACFWQG_06350 [Rhodococcus sp. NPDC058532]|uniref:hypothetical protein n=1 Tax=Rhodococcus sp. NPDC058532 TaxID=3346540 RepID=UPI00364ADAA4